MKDSNKKIEIQKKKKQLGFPVNPQAMVGKAAKFHRKWQAMRFQSAQLRLIITRDPRSHSKVAQAVPAQTR